MNSGCSVDLCILYLKASLLIRVKLSFFLRLLQKPVSSLWPHNTED